MEKILNIRAPIKKAVIPAIGRKDLFISKVQRQELMPIIDKPVIRYVVEEAVHSGIEEILIITQGVRGSLEALFAKDFEEQLPFQRQAKSEGAVVFKGIPDVKIYFTHQSEFNGLGHAVLYAREFIGNEPFAVLFSNEIFDASVPGLQQLFEIYRYYPGTILGVQEIAQSKVQEYVIIKPITLNERIYRVVDLIDKPSVSKAPSRLAVHGRCIFEPAVFAILEKITNGYGNQILLTTALRQLAVTNPVYAYQLEGRRYDVGDKQGHLEATIEFALKRNDTCEIFLQYLKQKLLPILREQ